MMMMMMKTRPQPIATALIILMVFTAAQCQENQSRRAVTEHQLMHDRGRSIQSLKRLIWLSSAIEGLHTAQTRSLTPGDPDSRWRSLGAGQLDSPAGRSHRRALETLLSGSYTPHLTSALDWTETSKAQN